MTEMKRKRKRLWPRAALGALGALVLAAGALVALQLGNIRALIESRTRAPEELARELEEQEARSGEILARLPEVSVRPPTEEEKEKIRSGETSAEEAAARLLAPPAEAAAPAGGGEDAGGGERSPPGETGAGPPREAELVAETYVLRETMTGQIEALVDAAKAEYTALPEEERTSAKKRELATRLIGEISGLEKNCDARIKEIAGELEAILKETGGDAGVAREIERAYEEEKRLKKAYYLSLYS